MFDDKKIPHNLKVIPIFLGSDFSYLSQALSAGSAQQHSKEGPESLLLEASRPQGVGWEPSIDRWMTGF